MVNEENFNNCQQLIKSGIDVETAMKQTGFLKEGEKLSEEDKRLIISLNNFEETLKEKIRRKQY